MSLDTGGQSAASALLDHLSAADLDLIGLSALTAAQQRERVLGVLGSDLVFARVFEPPTGDPLLAATPFCIFAVAVGRTATELSSTSYVAEWLGLGRRAPVFDVAELRGFMDDPWHRLFLAEVLASFTRVASGSMPVPTRRGVRRQRFSELDPVRLAGLLDVVREEERPGILRRLGDLSLFLTGVFPDYTARNGFGPLAEGRLRRSVGVHPDAAMPTSPTGDRGAVGLLEALGVRWYRAAYELVPRPVPANVAVLGEISAHFSEARRLLGFITERYLFPRREPWFGLGST